MTETEQTIFMSRPEGLARVLALDEDAGDLWAPDELRAMWQHQMRTAVDIDLSGFNAPGAGPLQNSAAMQNSKGKTFSELFADRQPAIELLKLTKEFAKQTLKDSGESQLKEIASALYYASYAAGIVRCGTRIGSMVDDELRPGFTWGLNRSWLDEATKRLFAEAKGCLVETGKSAGND